MSSNGPLVQFARYVDGQLQLFKEHTNRLDYIAVSHVWGDIEWLQVKGIPHEIKVSKKKAAFIEKTLPMIVKDMPFWMDIITVNQRDRAEVVATTQSIPAIFGHATRTLAVREGDGLYECCAEAMERFSDWEDLQSKMQDHSWTHYGHVNTEIYLQRLWTLQECLLSHTIDFVSISEDIPKDKTIHHLDTYHSLNNNLRVLDSLYVLAHSFYSDKMGVESLVDMYAFIRAYVSNGTISKQKPNVRSQEDDIYTGNFQVMNRSSNRQASMPRDYVFATMPQFPWFRLPEDAKSLKFNDIFLNLHQQAKKSGHGFAYRFTRSMTDPHDCHNLEDAWQPSKQQPEPDCLGDFLKLLGEHWPEAGDVESCFFTTTVKATAKHSEVYLKETLRDVESAMRFSPRIWASSHIGGELSRYGSGPDSDNELDNLKLALQSWVAPNPTSKLKPAERRAKAAELQAKLEALQRLRLEDRWIFPQARKILDFMWGAINPIQLNTPMQSDWEVFKRETSASWSSRLQQAILLLAAMVSCQVPLSAITWTEEHFIPVQLEFHKCHILGLLAKHAFTESAIGGETMLWCVGRHFTGESSGMDLVLVDPRSKMSVGVIPDFLDRNRTEEEYMDRIKILFHDLNPVVGPKGAAVHRVHLDAISVVSE